MSDRGDGICHWTFATVSRADVHVNKRELEFRGIDKVEARRQERGEWRCGSQMSFRAGCSSGWPLLVGVGDTFHVNLCVEAGGAPKRAVGAQNMLSDT